jgi:hypothetical protein
LLVVIHGIPPELTFMPGELKRYHPVHEQQPTSSVIRTEKLRVSPLYKFEELSWPLEASMTGRASVAQAFPPEIPVITNADPITAASFLNFSPGL